MKALARNKQTIYYALYKGKEKVYDANGLYTGDHKPSYEEPVKMRMNVSAARGSASVEMFGVNTNYSKVLVTDDMSCPIEETSVMWVGHTPNETADNYNYRVVRVGKSLNSIVYAISEIENG